MNDVEETDETSVEVVQQPVVQQPVNTFPELGERAASPAPNRMSKLEQFHKADDTKLARNELLFSWLKDDKSREEFYAELRKNKFPALRFKSRLGSASDDGWPSQYVYLLSGQQDIETALTSYSVEPYSALGSGGKFMLGLDRDSRKADSDDPHAKQNQAASTALRYPPEVIDAFAREAVRRALVLPLKNEEGRFDLPAVSEAAALRFVELLFGFRESAYRYLLPFMRGAYKQLTFQIIGRHFVPDSGLPPEGSRDVAELKQDLENEILAVKDAKREKNLVVKGITEKTETVIGRLFTHYGSGNTADLTMVALGLLAGTIGNVQAAVSIAINHFFADKNGLLLTARRAAQESKDSKSTDALRDPVMQALVRTPPAAFLARTSTKLTQPLAFQNDGKPDSIPHGAHVLLAMGAAENETFVFGGPEQSTFLHRCIGDRLAKPLILETVKEILLLPGLSQVIDRDDGAPKKLEKLWGVACEKYPLQFQRGRRLNQQPLHVVLPIAEPVGENAKKLEALLRGGAFVVEDALDDRKHVHFAWFMLVEGGTHLAMMTAYDGDFDAYVEHFATAVALFDEQLKLLEGAPPTPVRDHPKEFVKWIKKHNRTPMGGYFYSAYPTLSVADIINARKT